MKKLIHKRFLLAGFVLALLYVSQHNQAQLIKITGPVRLLALGDSYTIGASVEEQYRWANQLADSLRAKGVEVDTVAIIARTGWRTDNLLNAIRGTNFNTDFNLVGLCIGVNNQYQGTDIQVFQREFATLLDTAIQLSGNTSSTFILSIPDYAFTPFGQNSYNPTQITEEIASYNAIKFDYAFRRNVRYINITPISQQGLAQPDLVATDGLHPSGKQYALWVGKIMEHIVIDIDINTFTSDELLRHGSPVFKFIDGTIHISNAQNHPLFLRLYNVQGQLLFQQAINSQSYDLPLPDLNQRIIIYQLVNRHNLLLSTGKLAFF